MNKIILGAVLLLTLEACPNSKNDQAVSPSVTPRSMPVTRPTPFYESPLDPYTAKRVRNALGMNDGWTANEIRYQDAERAKYKKRLAAWEAQNGGAK